MLNSISFLKKKIIVFILICTFGFCLIPFVNVSYGAEYEYLASNLKDLGLFLGTGDGFALDEPCDRLMGAVILVRFLGKESDALSQDNLHPFIDVNDTYANKYIGYLYSKGLVQGQTDSSYGTGEMTSNQFATLMLRSLGYKDNVDFTWKNAVSNMKTLGIIPLDEVLKIEGQDFNRDLAVLLCYRTLLANPKGSTKALINKLLWEDVFTTDQLANTKNGTIILKADMPDLILDYTYVNNAQELEDLVLLSMRNNQLGVGFSVPGMTKDQLMEVYDNIISRYHWKAVLYPSVGECYDGYIYPHIGISDYLMMEYYYQDPERYQKSYQFYRKDLIDYNDSYQSLSEWAEKIDGIVTKTTAADMEESEKVKSLHDYLAENTEYDTSYLGSACMAPHYAEQVIFEGHGVCDGYAEAFKILMNGAGIECKVIYGNTPYGLHAWNQVKIDGEWYNIDVTWDDTSSGKRISYDFYCVPDSVFLESHQSEEICNAERCTSRKYYRMF